MDKLNKLNSLKIGHDFNCGCLKAEDIDCGCGTEQHNKKIEALIKYFNQESIGFRARNKITQNIVCIFFKDEYSKHDYESHLKAYKCDNLNDLELIYSLPQQSFDQLQQEIKRLKKLSFELSVEKNHKIQELTTKIEDLKKKINNQNE